MISCVPQQHESCLVTPYLTLVAVSLTLLLHLPCLSHPRRTRGAWEGSKAQSIRSWGATGMSQHPATLQDMMVFEGLHVLTLPLQASPALCHRRTTPRKEKGAGVVWDGSKDIYCSGSSLSAGVVCSPTRIYQITLTPSK